MSKWRNWDGSLACNPTRVCLPRSVGEVADAVRTANKAGLIVRTVGAGHSWSRLVPTDGMLISLDELEVPMAIDRASMRATVSAGMRLRDLGPLLQTHGLALKNLGAITSQSIAGAVSSGTHGTGRDYGVLGTLVTSMQIVDAAGQVRDFCIEQNPEEMAALRLSLGCLGIIVRVTLQCEADYSVRLSSFPMPIDAFLEQASELNQTHDRIRAYWFAGSSQALVETMDRTSDPTEPGSVYSWYESYIERKLIMGSFWAIGRLANGLVPRLNSLQERIGYRKQSRTGRCFDAITTPMPPKHEEAEVAVNLSCLRDAMAQFKDLASRDGFQVNVPSEVRFARADDVFLSPGYSQDVAYIGGYDARYRSGETFFKEFCGELAAKFGARPHWGKIGAPGREQARALFPGFDRFSKVRQEFDPEGVFANSYIQQLFALE